MLACVDNSDVSVFSLYSFTGNNPKITYAYIMVVLKINKTLAKEKKKIKKTFFTSVSTSIGNGFIYMSINDKM